MAAYRRFIGDSAKQVRDFLASGVTDEEIDAEVETLIQFEIQLAQVRTSAWYNFSSNKQKIWILFIWNALSEYRVWMKLHNN